MNTDDGQELWIGFEVLTAVNMNRQWTWFGKRWEISWRIQWLVVPQKGLCAIDWFIILLCQSSFLSQLLDRSPQFGKHHFVKEACIIWNNISRWDPRTVVERFTMNAAIKHRGRGPLPFYGVSGKCGSLLLGHLLPGIQQLTWAETYGWLLAMTAQEQVGGLRAWKQIQRTISTWSLWRGVQVPLWLLQT
jgi:hypothetical protein